MVKSDRRDEERPESPSRRQFPRPALWFNLLVLILGMAGLVVAQQHRRRLDARFTRIAQTHQSSPHHIAKIRGDLARMDLTQEGLERELESRLAIARSVEKEEFYLAIDTTNRKLRLHYGPEIVREADIEIGQPRVVKAGGKTWEFVPLKGALNVTGKLVDHSWRVPAWVYAMQSIPVPAETPVVAGGIGKYVVTLPNGYVIHSPPSAESPLKGPKPASFMAAEEHLEAIWPRISESMRVYVY